MSACLPGDFIAKLLDHQIKPPELMFKVSPPPSILCPGNHQNQQQTGNSHEAKVEEVNFIGLRVSDANGKILLLGRQCAGKRSFV